MTDAEVGDAILALREEFYADFPLDVRWLLDSAERAIGSQDLRCLR